MALGEAKFKIGIDGEGFRSGLKQTKSDFDRWGNQVRSQLLSVFGISFIKRQITGLIDWGSRMSDLAVQVGLSTDELQAFEYAALKTGVSLDEITTAFGLLGKARNDALRGLKTKKDAFSVIFGDQAEMALRAKSIKELTLDIANFFRTTDIGAAEMGVIKEIFGRGGPKLLPAFREGLPELLEMAQGSGAIMSEEQVKILDKMKDEIELFRKQAMVAMAPPLIALVNIVTKLLNETIKGFGIMGFLVQEIEQIWLDRKGEAKTDAMNTFESILQKEGFSDKNKNLTDGAPWYVKYPALAANALRRRKIAAQAAFGAIGGYTKTMVDDDEHGGGTVWERLQNALTRGHEYTNQQDAMARAALDLQEILRNVVQDPDLGGIKSSRKISSDKLSKIGGFVGASNRVLTVEEKQLRTQEAMREILRRGFGTGF